MASYFSKLSNLVSGGYTFPYVLGEKYSTAWGQWSHFQAEHSDTKVKVSVFRISSSGKDEPKMIAARSGVKRLRTVHAPLANCMPAVVRSCFNGQCRVAAQSRYPTDVAGNTASLNAAIMGSTCECAVSSTACGAVQRIARRTNRAAPACPQLRHPNVLQFKDTAEVEERGETVIYLVTEAVAPLADHLQRLDIQVPPARRQPAFLFVPWKLRVGRILHHAFVSLTVWHRWRPRSATLALSEWL